MSDPKRGALITVGVPKSAKPEVVKSVRLTINLVESNESKYPELNYKELVVVQEKKSKAVQNGKVEGLDPFSDNDDDVERVARKFEQKYGGKSTYGRKGKSKQDDFADIGAGYDENDSFIDNTDGYDEMIPPECDTLYGGFYINSGSLEFKTVPGDQLQNSDTEPSHKRNKRRIMSSSSDEESSDSSSKSSRDDKDKPVANGTVHLHKTEHRKKKETKFEKKKAKRIRADSSAATSGKQTSDDNAQGDGESADSHTSQSDSLTSKPAPSSENAVTSDSSRDIAELKPNPSWPTLVQQAVDDLKSHISRRQLSSGDALQDNDVKPLLIKIDGALSTSDSAVQKSVWSTTARLFKTTRGKLYQRVKMLVTGKAQPQGAARTASTSAPQAPPAPAAAEQGVSRKEADIEAEEREIALLTSKEKEAQIQKTLAKLKALIEDKKPAMIANYNLECSRVQEERKKMQAASSEGAPCIEKRLPKRRFPWCPTSRSLLNRLTLLAGTQPDAATLLAHRVLPLFPKGFVRMPTLLRQADLKTSKTKRQNHHSTSQVPSTSDSIVPTAAPTFTEPIQFPSSLTVTTTTKPSPEKPDVPQAFTDTKEPIKNKYHDEQTMRNFEAKVNKILSLAGKTGITMEKQEDRTKIKELEPVKAEENFATSNNIGSITITPVQSSKIEKLQSKTNSTNNVVASYEKQKESLIRVKSPAVLIKEANEMAKKEKDNRHKSKHSDKNPSLSKEKRAASPLHIETNFQPKEKNPSPNCKKDEITTKQIECMRSSEDKIPRPALVPVHHSPTFAKPDKRPPDAKKKKEIVIISDVDPLSDPLGELNNEPVAIDDSDSDVEVIEDKISEDSVKLPVKPKQDSEKPQSDLTKSKSELNSQKDTVPLNDKIVIQCSVQQEDGRKPKDKERHKEKTQERRLKMDVDETDAAADIDTVMRNLREMQDSQEPNFNSNSYGGVVSSGSMNLRSRTFKRKIRNLSILRRAKRVKASSDSADVLRQQRSDKNKLAERNSLTRTDGCNSSQVDIHPEPTTPSS